MFLSMFLAGMQIPSNLPHKDNTPPLDTDNPLEIIVYIVIPIVLFAAYILLRKKSKSKRDSRSE